MMRFAKFCAADSGLPEGGAAIPAVESPPPGALDPLTLPPGYELEPEAPVEPSRTDLEARYAALLAEKTRLESAKDSSAAYAASLDKLSAGLAGLAQRPVTVQAPQAQPQIDIEAEEKALDDSFLEAPVKSIKKVASRLMEPAVAGMFQANQNMARAIMQRDPGEGAYFTRYATEVDAEVAKLPALERMQDPLGCYSRALAVVKSVHFTDIIAEEKAKWEAAASGAQASAGGQVPQAPAGAPARVVSPSLPGSPMAPKAAAAKVTRADYERAQNIYQSWGAPIAFESVLEMVKNKEI